MKRSRTVLTVFTLVVTLLLLSQGISMVQGRMNSIRETEKLTDTNPLENAPPMMVFTTVALGGFRGLVADWLWLRSNRMKEKGNYFEMVQLASWLVKLQPRFSGAHAFLGWNMAYNVSVTFTNFEDRWRWVQRGIELLRDEALVYNPGDPGLYAELGWIYQHKLGKNLDTANRYYKTEMAKEFMTVLGGYPPDWQNLADAPEDEAELKALLGEDSPLWVSLARFEVTLDDLERAFRGHGSFEFAESQTENQEQTSRLQSARDVVAELEDEGLLPVLENYFRSRWLRLVYKLEPELIMEINDKYGDLDWRLPQAHAIYWATRGLENAEGQMYLKCDRMIVQSLAAAFKTGRLLYMVGENMEGGKQVEYLEMTPNISIADAIDEAYVTTLEKHEGLRGMPASYENFLIDAIVTFYAFGEEEKAREYLLKGRERYGKKFNRSLDEFALDELAKDIATFTQEQAQAMVQAYLTQTCTALAFGDYDRAFATERIAFKIYQKYGEQKETAKLKRLRQRGLPPYSQMKRNAVKQCLQGFPPLMAKRLRAALGDVADQLQEMAEESQVSEDS